MNNIMITVKLLCNWCNSKELANSWNKMSQGNFRWNNIKIVTDDKEIPTFYCVINYTSEFYVPEKTIYMRMEPTVHDQYYNSNYERIVKSKLLYILPRNNTEWHLAKTYKQLLIEPVIKTSCLSTVTSDKYQDPGHIKRIEFLKYLSDRNLEFDLFGKSNRFNFKNYRGSLPLWEKDAGILPYKYTIACENSSEPNYFTEKIIDAILGECLCFYWGCPNISEYIDKRAYIVLNLDDMEYSYRLIKTAIETNQWEARIKIIRKEKIKILNELQFFPTLEKICIDIQKGKR